MSSIFGFALILLCISCVYGECPVGTYLRDSSCERCLPECRSGQEVVGTCKETKKFMCQCPSNKFWHGNLALCKLCEKCGPGEIIIKNCSHNHDRACTKCPVGTFVRTSHRCEKCSHCEVGEVVTKKCSGSNDTVCRSVTKDPHPFLRITDKPVVAPTEPDFQTNSETNSTTITILSIFVALFGVAFILACLCWCCSARPKRRIKHPESSLTDVSEIVDSVKKKLPALPTVRDNGMMFRDLNPEVVEELCLRLNPDGFRNWKTLAGRLNCTQCEIQNFSLHKGEACGKLFQWWSTEKGSSVYVLYKHLLDMKRDDCTEILLKHLTEEDQV